MRWMWLLCLFCSFVSFGCQPQETTDNRLPDAARVQELLELSNKQLLVREEQAIDDFALRHGIDLKRTGSGLRYRIEQDGEGPGAGYADYVELDYSVYLLNGDLMYSSGDEGPLAFRVGRGGAVAGIDEGVRLLNRGAKATFIIPYHLAHGMPGDGKRIPGRSTIIYRVELTNIL